MAKKIKIHSILVSDGPGCEGVYSYASVLPLGMLVSYAKVYKDGMLNNFFAFQTFVNRTQEQFHRYIDEQLIDAETTSIWLVSSYVWNHDNNMEFARVIKSKLPRSVVIAGGPHIPAFEADLRAFLQAQIQIDITIRGQGEIALAETLAILGSSAPETWSLGLSGVMGISFRNNGLIARTADRERNLNLDIFPSPYLSGEFDDPSFDDMKGMVLETNRGCPFGCTFCDWGSATLQKFSMFDLEKVKKEIDFIARKRAAAIYLSDSNFGAFERDVEIAQYIADTKKSYGYPKTLGSSFAKNASEKLVKITKILYQAKLKSTGMISIQSTDETVLKTIARSNIKQEKHEKLIRIFSEEGMQLSSELMIGLPGQTVESHKKDLQYFFDRKLITTAFCTQIMPNAPMNEPSYRELNKIVANEDGFVISTSTFSEDDYHFMIKIFLSFQFFYVLGVLKYFLYYLQMEHSIKAMDFVEELLLATKADSKNYPLGFELQKNLLGKMDPKMKGLPTIRWNTEDSKFIFNNLDAYYGEIVKFLSSKYRVEIPATELRTLLAVQKAVMPVMGKKVPLEIKLEHDFASYFEQLKKCNVVSSKPANFRPLAAYPGGALVVKARMPKTIDNLNLLRIDLHTNAGWELKSKLRL